MAERSQRCQAEEEETKGIVVILTCFFFFTGLDVP